MKIHKGIRNAVLAAILGAYGTSVSAQTVIQEVENHGGAGAAQGLTLGGVGSVITINGYIGRADCPNPPVNPAPTGCLDADFFSFNAQKGTVLTFNIENAMIGERHLDTFLNVFGPGPNFEVKRLNDDKPRPRGAALNTDSAITTPPFLVSETGTYTVGVSAFPGLVAGGIFNSTTLRGRSVGNYTLIVTVVSLPVIPISIDIKPGSGERAPINPKSKGNIPVALLGSDTFNPFDVYPESMTFGAKGDEGSYLRCAKEGVDVNNDGHLDRVCHFENQTAGFARGDNEGILRGKTKDGGLIEGAGPLKVAPQKADDN